MQIHPTSAPLGDPRLVVGTPASPVPGNLDDAEYAAFRARVAQRLQTNAAAGALFTTDADVWTAYIQAFPESPVRQHHNCTACRHFLQRYGGLAVITDTGELRPALWEDADADETHRIAVLAMARAVRRARVTGVFYTRDEVLGTAITGPWVHLAAETPACARHTAVVPELGARIGEKIQDHANVSRALGEYDITILRQAVDLLKSDALYRGEKVLGPAQWLLELAEAVRVVGGFDGTSGGRSRNLIWRAVAKAPAGFCHPRSSMVGTLLDDLASGVGFGEASRRFREKMDPLVYQRPQAAPTAGAVRAAEDLVAKLGIAPALKRRFARLEDIGEHALWRRPEVLVGEPVVTGVFGHLAVRSVRMQHRAPAATTAQAVTWTRFSRIALTDACSIEVRVPVHGNFVALVTAQDPVAPPILQWDRPEGPRNPVSWYLYHAGSPASRWGLVSGAWAPVDAACLMPWAWTAPDMKHHAPGAILIIRGARDSSHQGAALFPEILRSELHGARAVIEAYSAREQLADAEEASACGILAVGATVRVTAKSGAQVTYQIDRWD